VNMQNHQLADSSWGEKLRASFGMTIIALGLCGFVYSAAATSLGQMLFPKQANGSLIVENNQVIGSRLVAQPFAQVQYFPAIYISDFCTSGDCHRDCIFGRGFNFEPISVTFERAGDCTQNGEQL
jgi:hypothetical protein